MTGITERITASVDDYSKCGLCEILGFDTNCKKINGQEKKETTEGSKKVNTPGTIRQCIIRSRIVDAAYIATNFSKKVDRLWKEEGLKNK